MKIDIKHIAKLSRLRVNDDEVEKFTQDMENIVSMIENLPQLDDTGALVDPTNPMILREDVAEHRFRRDELMQNAPQKKAGCVVVPKVVE
jgi:aspartyl-tRNA(Asn)/glutamyl-tRNA(Gln) amidotransferase subunit C